MASVGAAFATFPVGTALRLIVVVDPAAAAATWACGVLLDEPALVGAVLAATANLALQFAARTTPLMVDEGAVELRPPRAHFAFIAPPALAEALALASPPALANALALALALALAVALALALEEFG